MFLFLWEKFDVGENRKRFKDHIIYIYKLEIREMNI